MRKMQDLVMQDQSSCIYLFLGITEAIVPEGLAKLFLQEIQSDALSRSQACKDKLIITLSLRQLLHLQRCPSQISLQRIRMEATLLSIEGMGTSTNTQIRNPMPVTGIVT